MVRDKKHIRCPNVIEILEAYKAGLADRDYTLEWLIALGKSKDEAERLLNE